MITKSIIQTFQRDGAVVVRNALSSKWLNVISNGIERNLLQPSEYASENDVTEGRFFDDYVNWRRIPEYKDLVRHSPAAKLAAQIMESSTAQVRM